MNFYEVSYSIRVREVLKSLVVRAQVAGAASRVIQAIHEFDRRLRIYPQFGQPLQNLSVAHAQLWIGVISPLVIRYVINEDLRRVMVVTLPQVLPRCGF